MASHIEAIIFGGNPGAAGVPHGLKTVSLSAGLTMLPLTDEVLEHLGDADPNGDRIKPNWILRRRVATLAERMSADRKVLYVFGETWGDQAPRKQLAGAKAGRSTALPGPATLRLTANLATRSSHIETARSKTD